MVSKGRVDKAVEKYKELLSTLKQYGLTVASLYEDRAAIDAKLGERFDSTYRVSLCWW